MRHHLYDKKKACPALVNDLLLTDDIKDYILANHFYRPPVVQAPSKTPARQRVTQVELIHAIEQQASSVSLKVVAVCEYIYLVYVREFKIRGEPIYKIGRSTQENLNRFKQYPKGSLLLLLLACKDCVSTERALLAKFKTKYTQCTEYGTEYFNGNSDEMIRDVFNEIMLS